MTRKVEINITTQNNVHIIEVGGDLDLYNTPRLKEIFIKMQEKGVKKYVLNLENIRNIDSSGLGTLVFIADAVKKHQLEFCLSNVSRYIYKNLELTKLLDFFTITESVGEAVEQLSTG
jgi:anti-sigma B factor antagonist